MQRTAHGYKRVLRCRYCFTLTDIESTRCNSCIDVRARATGGGCMPHYDDATQQGYGVTGVILASVEIKLHGIDDSNGALKNEPGKSSVRSARDILTSYCFFPSYSSNSLTCAN